MRLRYSANSMKVHVVSPPEFTKLDCKSSTTIITRVQRELVSWAVVGQIGYQGSLGGPPIMTSGRLSLPSTPINPLGSPNEVHPRGVPGRWWVPASQALRQPLHRPAHHVQHLNATLHQSTHPLDKWADLPRSGQRTPGGSGSLEDEEWGPPTHPPTHEATKSSGFPPRQPEPGIVQMVQSGTSAD